jgi:hypothetical protein
MSDEQQRTAMSNEQREKSNERRAMSNEWKRKAMSDEQ